MKLILRNAWKKAQRKHFQEFMPEWIYHTIQENQTIFIKWQYYAKNMS